MKFLCCKNSLWDTRIKKHLEMFIISQDTCSMYITKSN